MLELYLRYYPSQFSTQFVGDLFLGGNASTCLSLIKILQELTTSRKILTEISSTKPKRDPLGNLTQYHCDTFELLEWHYYEGLDRVKFEHKGKRFRIHLNQYTLDELITSLQKLQKEKVDYGMDAYELVSQEGVVKRADRRLWFVRLG